MVFPHHFVADRAPEAPRPDILVKLFQRVFILRFAPERPQHAADDRKDENDREEIKRINAVAQDFFDQRRHDHRADDAGEHAVKVAVAVEPPPDPFEHIGHDVAAIQRTDDPHHHIGDAGGQQAEEDAGGEHDHRPDPAQAHLRLRR